MSFLSRSRCHDLRQRHRLQSLAVHSDIELTGDRFQASVGMAMKVDRTFPHLVPRPECIVAQYQVLAILPKLGIVLDAHPPFRCRCCLRIVVANNQMLATFEESQESRTVSCLPQHKVSQVPNFVVITDDRIPVLNKRCIVGSYVGERSTINPENARVSEVGITREEDHTASPKYRTAA